MNELNTRRYRDTIHLDRIEWATVFGQYHRDAGAAGSGGEYADRKDFTNTDTIIGVLYIGALIVLMLVYLT